jgi:hypothetical protein
MAVITNPLVLRRRDEEKAKIHTQVKKRAWHAPMVRHNVQVYEDQGETNTEGIRLILGIPKTVNQTETVIMNSATETRTR